MLVLFGVAAGAFETEDIDCLRMPVLGVEDFMAGDADPARHERGEHTAPNPGTPRI